MIKIGITGQAGFIGTIYITPCFVSGSNISEPLQDEFSSVRRSIGCIRKTGMIVPFLAAMNRHNDPNVLYKTNIELVQKLIDLRGNAQK